MQASSKSNYNDFYYWFYGGNNQNCKEQTGSGSGVIVSETDDQLLIVTNNHVISDNSYGDAKKVQVTFSDDKTVEATVKGADSDADLAVLTVKKSDLEKSTLENVKVAVIGDSDSVNVGDDVIAIGMAYPIPSTSSEAYLTELIPINSPLVFNNAPPELPGLIAASV